MKPRNGKAENKIDSNYQSTYMLVDDSNSEINIKKSNGQLIPKKERGSWSEKAKILSRAFGRGEMGRSFHMSAPRYTKVAIEKRFCY